MSSLLPSDRKLIAFDAVRDPLIHLHFIFFYRIEHSVEVISDAMLHMNVIMFGNKSFKKNVCL